MSWRSHAICLFNDRVRMDHPRFFELSIKYGEWSRGDMELVGHPKSQSITTGRENHDGVAFPQFAHLGGGFSLCFNYGFDVFFSDEGYSKQREREGRLPTMVFGSDPKSGCLEVTLVPALKLSIVPENQWLEDFLFCDGLISSEAIY